jgi:hypothetical protein
MRAIRGRLGLVGHQGAILGDGIAGRAPAADEHSALALVGHDILHALAGPVALGLGDRAQDGEHQLGNPVAGQVAAEVDHVQADAAALEGRPAPPGRRRMTTSRGWSTSSSLRPSGRSVSGLPLLFFSAFEGAEDHHDAASVQRYGTGQEYSPGHLICAQPHQSLLAL